MSSDARTGLRRFKTAVSGIQEPIPRPATVAAKFYLCGSLGQLLWLTLWSFLSSTDPTSTPTRGSLLVVAMLTVPALAAAGIYLHLPTETVDRYHQFGKGSAMFFGVNIFLSSMFVVYQFTKGELVAGGQPIVTQIIGAWVIASVFLPGLWAGCVVASRWAK